MTQVHKIAAKASMYFRFDGKSRPDVTALTTFEAIQRGQRRATTRFPAWPGYRTWETLKSGDVVRFFADRACVGAFVDCVIESKTYIDLARCSDATMEEWSRAEGWIAQEGRQLGRRYGVGLHVCYRKLGSDPL